MRMESISKSEIIEKNNYNPFDLKQKEYNNYVNPNGKSVAQKLKYNGKEHNVGIFKKNEKGLINENNIKFISNNHLIYLLFISKV